MSNAIGRHFQVIFDHAPSGMAILDSAARPLYTNIALQTMLGRSDGELRDASLFDFVHADDGLDFRDQFSEIADSASRHFQTTGRYYRSDGSTGWWKLDVTHVISEGHSPFIFCVVEDVTELKADSEKLKRAKEFAERATRTKSAFLANMSHEIRTPIHTITGMTELMLDTRLDDEQREYALQVRFSAEVLLGLINDILDFSKIEAGKLSLETIEFDLAPMVEDAVDMVSLEAHKRGLEVILFLDPALPGSVTGDPVRLRQIVVNLFNNAVKFTQTGEIVIRVEPIKRQNETTTILFEVVDSGIGIPKEKLTRLFQAFTQVDSSTTRKFGGTGLGLSISRNLVRLMGGNIGVKSQEGKGSTFWFMIPFPAQYSHGPVTVASDASPSNSQTVESSRDPGFVAGYRLAPFEDDITLLLVDDNATFRRLTLKYLECWFKHIDVAEDGPTALRMLHEAADQRQPYDVALVDLMLPGMDGWQFASEVNADRRINSTRLVLMSPTGKASGEAKMKLLGWFNAYVNKPLKMKELHDALQLAVSGTFDLDSPDDEAHIGELLPEDAEPVASAGSSNGRVNGSGSAGRAPAGNAGVPGAGAPAHTILVAEDHIVNQQLFKTILERKGYSVLLAANGNEAIEVVQNKSVDLVFMDVQMPEKNGYEASQEIRKLGHKVPIVAVTANALKGERERCLQFGMNDYLTKPFKSRDIVPILERWLPAETSADAASARPGVVRPDVSAAAPAAGPAPSRSAPAEAPAPGRSAPAAPAATIAPAATTAPAPGDNVRGLRIFDFAKAVDAFMGKEDIVRKVVGEFIKRVDAQLSEIGAYLESDNFESASIEAHGIKGGSWNLEAQTLGDAGAALEKSTRERDADVARADLAALTDAFREFRAYCETLPQLQSPVKTV